MLLPCFAFLAELILLLLGNPALGENATESLLLPGTPIERTLDAGGGDLFGADLTAGKPWLLQVEQLGIDVVLEIKDSRGQSLLTVDTPQGREGTETLLLTPDLGGPHRIEVRSERQGVPPGRFRIRLERLPAATPEDRLRVRAERNVMEAGRIWREGEDGAVERALAALREALDAWRELGDRRKEARTRFLLGTFCDEIEDRRNAAAAFARALAVYRQLEDPGGTAAALDRLGRAHLTLGEVATALPYLEEALGLRRSRGEQVLEAEDPQPPVPGPPERRPYSGSRHLLRTDPEDRPRGGRPGARSHSAQQPAEQERFLRQALELQRHLGDTLGEAITLNNLGAFHRGLGEVEDALLHYGEALALFEHLGNRFWLARTLNNIGFAYLSVGELERARAYLLRALPLRRAVGDRAGEAVTSLNLGRTVAALGETVRALAFYRRALEINLEAGNRRGTTVARQLLGELHLERGEPAAAREALETALAELRQRGQRRQEAEVLTLLARVFRAQWKLDPQERVSEPEKARELAARALDLHREVRNPVGEITALALLARIDRDRGRTDAVREHLETALEVLERLQGHLGDPNQKASFLASQREVHTLHVGFLMELHRRSPAEGHDREALEASERARSRSLLAMLEGAGTGLEPALDPALGERLRTAERSFTVRTRKQIEVLGGEHSPEQALAAEQALYTALAELDNVRAVIRRRNPRYAALSRPETLGVSEIRALLDPDTVLLEYFLGEERSFLWWVPSAASPAAITAFELPPEPVLDELARQVHRQLSEIHQRTGADREALAELGRILLGPVANRLDGQRLVVVADGALHAVPFAALPLPGEGPGAGEPVLSRHEVVSLPSASVLASQRRMLPRAREEGHGSAATVAILADPIFDRRDARIGQGAEALADFRNALRSGLDDLDRLPYTRREAEAIAALLPLERRLLALGTEARRARVVDGGLRDYGILHFATHGLVNPRTPEISGLMLSRVGAQGEALEGFLGLHDLASLELSAELVVLSGCRTAVGREIRGEGWVGLNRGFLYAGVPRVVASLWQVRDEATAKLMTRFYRAMLIDGERPAAALRTAQLELREERRRTRSAAAVASRPLTAGPRSRSAPSKPNLSPRILPAPSRQQPDHSAGADSSFSLPSSFS